MSNKKFSNNDLLKTSLIQDFDEKKLNDFFKKVYNYRSYRLENFWKWLYRIDFLEKKNPVVVIKDEKIAGHMALVPFWLNIKGKKVSAAWYVDLFVLPKYRGLGIANEITKDLMKLTDVCLSFGNEQSMGVFNKYGWKKTYDTYLHYFFLKPMNHPKLNKFYKYLKLPFYLINSFFNNVMYAYYLLKRNKKCNLEISLLSKKNINIFANNDKPSNTINTIIDEDYLDWRFLKSPYLSSYKIFKYNNNLAALIRERKDKPLSWHVDILLFNDLSNSEDIFYLLIEILIWSKKNNFSYVRSYFADKNLSKKLKNNLASIVKHPRFAYFANNKIDMDLLNNEIFSWQLVDSDFEFIS